MKTPVSQSLAAPTFWSGLHTIAEFQQQPFTFLSRKAQTRIDRARFGNYDVYFLNNPDDIAHVLVTNAKNYHKDRFSFTMSLQMLLGNGLLTSEDDLWLRQRRMIQPSFHRKCIETYTDTMLRFASDQRMHWQDGSVYSIDQDMMRLTLDIATVCFFGAHSSDGTTIGRAFTEVSQHYATLGGNPLIPLWLPIPANRRYRQALQELETVVQRLIQTKQSEIKAGAHPDDILALLLEMRDDANTSMSNQQVRDEVMTMLLAGHETSALTLSYTLYLLARYPSIQAMLVKELETVLGGDAPQLDTIRQLHYLDQVIKESMRLYPPAYAFGREACADDTIAGYHIPSKAQVVVCPYTMHRNPHYYIHPHVFYPERWTEEFQQSLPRYAYFPFGGGSRQCIGRDFALLEMQVVLAAILQHVTFELVDDSNPVLQAAITMRPRDGIQLRVRTRSASTSPVRSTSRTDNASSRRCT
jgi:cytochrome P450